jgi:NADPH-dependent 2,4-dienoyl-CoA reductase/sulfur reductase-like enzyme
MLWAAHIRRRRLKARVTLIDPRSQPTPAAVAEGLMRGMEAYGPVLAYEPFTEVRSVDPASRVAETEVGRLEYDVLSVIPPHRAMSFIAAAGLGEPFADVDPTTFRSSRDERIWALGDTADTPFSRTGYTAMDSAAVAAWSIARDLGVNAAVPPVPANRCYPMVAADRALLIETHWALGRDEAGGVHVTVTGRHDNRASASHARLRRQWEARAISTLFGLRGDLR